MYLPDLAPYDPSYLGGCGEGFVRRPGCEYLAIGWLDAGHDVPRGPVAEEILRKVLVECFDRPRNQTRGFFRSPFTAASQFGYPVVLGNRRTLLGSAEIHIAGKNGRVYVSPNLIYHYIKDVGYRPPDEFLDAVRTISV